jgi:hypothetical protein
MRPGSKQDACDPSQLDRRHLACPCYKFSGTEKKKVFSKFIGFVSFFKSATKMRPGSRLEACDPSQLDRRHLACSPL